MQTDPIHAVVPAAGVGRRLGSQTPKQYLTLAGQTVLEHSVERLSQALELCSVVVATQADDPFWPTLPLAESGQVIRCDGGEQRADSVLNALEVLRYLGAEDQDWVLVHDAARPCVSEVSIQRLLAEVLAQQACGGLLAVPVADTLKRADAMQRIAHTVDRQGLWRAQTPQLFRLGQLYQALDQALQQGIAITDEAAAMELAGFAPLLVEGDSDNLKITLASDLALAEQLLSS